MRFPIDASDAPQVPENLRFHPQQDTLTVKWMMERFAEAAQAKEPVVSCIRRWNNVLKGRQWQYMRQPEGDRENTKLTINRTLPICKGMVYMMTDSRPRILVLPIDSNSAENAQMLSDFFRVVWHDRDGERTLTRVLDNGVPLGTGIWHTYMDMQVGPAFGQGAERPGDINSISIPPLHCYPDPWARSLDDCTYFMVVTHEPVGRLRKLFPSALPVKQESMEGSQASASSPYLDNHRVLHSPAQDPHNRKWVYRCWHESGARLTIMVGDRIMYDGPNPLHDEYPFAVYRDVGLDDSFWGLGLVSQVEPLQFQYNKLQSLIIDHFVHELNIPWLLAGIEDISAEDVTNARGGVLTTESTEGKLMRIAPEPLPGYGVAYASTPAYEMQALSGVFDVRRGAEPARVRTGVGIAEMREAAEVGVRGRARAMHWMLTRVGRQQLAITRRYYRQPAMYALRGEVEPSEEVQFFSVPRVNAQGRPISIQGLYEVDVQSDASLPYTKLQRAQQALQLAQLGLITPEMLFEMIELPDRDRALQQLRQMQEAAQAQAQEPPEAEPGPELPPMEQGQLRAV
jgi:hypothetical protein